MSARMNAPKRLAFSVPIFAFANYDQVWRRSARCRGMSMALRSCPKILAMIGSRNSSCTRFKTGSLALLRSRLGRRRDALGLGAGARRARLRPLLLIDLTYFAANSLKIVEGGWFPIAVGRLVAYVVVTWRRGREVLRRKLYGHALTPRSFIDKLDPKLTRVKGTAVFMTGNPDAVPNALLHNLKHNKVLHERVVLMTVRRSHVPTSPNRRAASRSSELGQGFCRVILRYGFAEEPNIPGALERCRGHGLRLDLMLTHFFFAARPWFRRIGPACPCGATAVQPWRATRFRHRLFPHPGGSADGAGHAGGDLSAGSIRAFVRRR